MTSTTPPSATARVVLDSFTPATTTQPARVVVSVPTYAYQIELQLQGDSGNLAERIGKRIAGVIRGKALRMWQATAGGCFIEPVWGSPRIVQGRVLAVDVQANAILLDLVFPAWVELEASQTAGSFQTGDMLNFYVSSGMTFTPAL